jgi:hypothetical protein
LKNEILWESFGVPRHGLIECTGLDSVNGRKVSINENFAPANRQDQRFDRFMSFHQVSPTNQIERSGVEAVG